MFTFDCLTKFWSRKYFNVDNNICLRLIFWQNYFHINDFCVDNKKFSHLIFWQNYGHTNDFCVDNTLDASGNVIEIALKCEMGPSKVSI